MAAEAVLPIFLFSSVICAMQLDSTQALDKMSNARWGSTLCLQDVEARRCCKMPVSKGVRKFTEGS